MKLLFYESLALHAGDGMKKRVRRSRKVGHLLGSDHDWHLMAAAVLKSRHLDLAKELEGKREDLQKRIFHAGRSLFRKSHKTLKKKLILKDK